MGASEDRANLRTEQRETAVRWLIDLLCSAPEPTDGVDEEVILEELRAELDEGSANYSLRIAADEETLQSMPPAQIAEQLLHELASIASVIRRERRVLANAEARPNYEVGQDDDGTWSYVIFVHGNIAAASGLRSRSEAEGLATYLLGVYGVEPVERQYEELVEIPIAEAA